MQFDLIKTKLSKTLKVPEENIYVYTKPDYGGKTSESIEINGKPKYFNKGFLKNENTISDEISDYIKQVAEMKDLADNIEYSDIDRKEIISIYNDMILKTEQFAAMQMDKDEQGNIYMKVTKVGELNQENSASEKSKTEEQEER